MAWLKITDERNTNASNIQGNVVKIEAVKAPSSFDNGGVTLYLNTGYSVYISKDVVLEIIGEQVIKRLEGEKSNG